MSEITRIAYGGGYRVSARQGRASIRFPVSAPGMSEAAEFANETVPLLLPGFTDGVVVLQEIATNEKWSWNLNTG